MPKHCPLLRLLMISFGDAETALSAVKAGIVTGPGRIFRENPERLCFGIIYRNDWGF